MWCAFQDIPDEDQGSDYCAHCGGPGCATCNPRIRRHIMFPNGTLKDPNAPPYTGPGFSVRGELWRMPGDDDTSPGGDHDP